jgi:regulator of protease activity HflC (stomatin/prohibitin superfamily)
MNAAQLMTTVPDMELVLARSLLPENLQQRLRDDSHDALYQRISSVSTLEGRQPNTAYCGTVVACFCCNDTTLVEQGRIGILKDGADYVLLAPGYHKFPSCGTENIGDADLKKVNEAVTFGAAGFVTITEGYIGVLQAGPAFRLLAPGTYQWDSPSVRFVQAVNIATARAKLGPYELLTVAEAEVAVTYNNGVLATLGWNAPGERKAAQQCRAYFLDDPKWKWHGTLSLQMQTDRLESNDLLSKDNVELLMVAMSQWRIVDPDRCVNNCADTMEAIRVKVNLLIRATIARIVAGTCIGGTANVAGVSGRPVVQGAVVGDFAEPHKEEAGLAHLMQSDDATRHMAELSVSMDVMGVEVVSVYVPEKRMVNENIREQVAKQAVIGIKADAERSCADAAAYARVKAAMAEAESIELLAAAHADAGARLGAPDSTAARLALTETTSKVLEGANMTIFSGAPSTLPFMLNAPMK